MFSKQNFIRMSLLSMCYMGRPSDHPWFDHNNIWLIRGLYIVNLLVRQFSPACFKAAPFITDPCISESKSASENLRGKSSQGYCTPNHMDTVLMGPELWSTCKESFRNCVFHCVQRLYPRASDEFRTASHASPRDAMFTSFQLPRPIFLLQGWERESNMRLKKCIIKAPQLVPGVYYGYQVKDDEIGMAYSTYGSEDCCI
jgi:hypothetical protein